MNSVIDAQNDFNNYVLLWNGSWGFPDNAIVKYRHFIKNDFAHKLWVESNAIENKNYDICS